jgi:hypothetical protein
LFKHKSIFWLTDPHFFFPCSLFGEFFFGDCLAFATTGFIALEDDSAGLIGGLLVSVAGVACFFVGFFFSADFLTIQKLHAKQNTRNYANHMELKLHSGRDSISKTKRIRSDYETG